MKTSLALGSALAVLLLASNALAAKHNLKATFTATAGSGTGSAVLTYDDAAGKLCGTVTYAGLTGPVTAAHIHDAADGVLVSLTAAASPMPILVDVSSSQGTEILGGGTYINLHTAANAGGEIKGDIVADPSGTDQCATSATDGGTDGGSTSSSSSGGSSTSSSGGSSSSSSSSSGATTVRADSGTTSAAPAEDDGGCSTTGSSGSSGNGLAIALGLGVAAFGVARGRKNRR